MANNPKDNANQNPNDKRDQSERQRSEPPARQ